MSVIEAPTEVDRAAELKTAALNWVNDIRAEYNAEPLIELPQGLRGCSSACVLAEALRLALCNGSPVVPPPDYDGGRYGSGPAALAFARDGKFQTRPIPSDVTDFILRFDAGGYPELIASSISFASVSIVA